MARKAEQVKLAKAGMEFDALVDEFYGRKGRVPAALNSYEAAKIYGGALIVDYPRRNKEAVFDGYEVVKLHDGKLIVDYSKRKPVAYYYNY